MTKTVAYHIKCKAGDVAKYVLLPGDPARAEKIAEYFDHSTLIAKNREFWTYTGDVSKVPISVTSTGIGGPSTAIAIEELGVEVMGLALVEVAEPEVEALAVRRAGGVGPAQRPLADAAGGISGLLEHTRDSPLARLKHVAGIGANRSVTTMATGQQHQPRRSADRVPRVVVGEAHSLLGQAVEVGRADHLLAVAA